MAKPSISFSISKEAHDKLKKFAKLEIRSLSNSVETLIMRYADLQDYHKDKNGKS